MMLVKDIMTKKVISVKPKTSINEVARLLNKYNIHGVPVVTGKNTLAGIITESDFFVKNLPNVFLPTYIGFFKKTDITKSLAAEQKKQADNLLKTKARDIMTAECCYVFSGTALDKLIKIFKRKHVYTIPVVDRNKKVAGVVTLADVIKLFNFK